MSNGQAKLIAAQSIVDNAAGRKSFGRTQPPFKLLELNSVRPIPSRSRKIG